MIRRPTDLDLDRFLAGFAAAERYRGQQNLRLHLGPGPVRLPGWIRVSADPGVGDLDLDLRLALPFDDGAVELIYAPQLPDTLGEELVAFIVEAARVLRRGGRLRLVGRDRTRVEAEVRRLALQGVLDLDRLKALPAWSATDVIALFVEAGFDSAAEVPLDVSGEALLAGLETQIGLTGDGPGWFAVEAAR
jgi:SAM-dependent methyltransferase